MKTKKTKDAWRDVKKSLTTPKKSDWMTKEKKNLAKVSYRKKSK